MISCDQYDYIEIVCMYRYPIKVTMKAGDVIECIALDTTRNASREECIRVTVNGIEADIVLSELATLEVSIENPHFNIVSFN